MSPEQSAAVQKIREALAAGPTDGPWSVLDGNRVSVSLASQHAECGFSSHCVALTHGVPRLNPEVNAAYIAACDPATIRALLAALDAAQAERDALQARIAAFEAEWDAYGNARAAVARATEREECAAQLDALGCDHCAAAIRARTKGDGP